MRHPDKHGRARPSFAARLGGWSVRHRKTAVIGWLLFVIAASMIGAMAGQTTMKPYENGAGDSARAEKILADAGIQHPAGEMVILHSEQPGGWRDAAGAVAAGVRATGRIDHLQPALAAKDGRDGLVRFEMTGDADTAPDRVQPVLDAVARVEAAHPEVTIGQFGDASSGKWLNDILGKDFAQAEWTAVPLALGILLIAFGARLAALRRVGLALPAFIAANGLLAVASHSLHVFDTTSSVMLLMGLAVGVDYCLFYIRRERDERAAGHDKETALRIAAATSGRSVLVSGLTVMLAMAGMFLSGLLLFKGFALATIIVVLIAMMGSVTVLPALLSWLGDRIDAGRVPLLNRRDKRGKKESGRIAGKLLRPVLAKPKFFAAASVVVLLVLAAPALGMKTESLGLEKQFGSDSALSVAYRHINETFPGGPAPARVVVEADDTQAPAVREALAGFDKVTVHRERNIAEIEVPLPGGKAALSDLREDRLPAAFDG